MISKLERFKLSDKLSNNRIVVTVKETVKTFNLPTFVD